MRKSYLKNRRGRIIDIHNRRMIQKVVFIPGVSAVLSIQHQKRGLSLFSYILGLN